MSDPVSLARALLSEDPDPETRAELEALLKRVEGGDEAARRDLDDRFTGPAGVRHRGPARARRGGALAHEPPGRDQGDLGLRLAPASRRTARTRRTRGVVIGFDGRHSSRRFAEDAAAVLAGLGIPVRLFPDPVPTPLLAFSVPQLGAAGGVMVTASHNPPWDNGYKAYMATGGQIIPPVDGAIARQIAAAPRCDAIARPAPADAAARGLRALVDARDAAVEEAYLDGLARASLHPRRSRIAAHRLHADARRRPPARDPRVRPGRIRGRGRRAGAGRSRRRLPHRLLPEPRGAGSDGPRARAGRRDAAPSWCWPTTRTRIGWRPRCPTRRAAATGCSRATRSACCSPTTRSSTPRRADGRSWWSRRWSPRACSRAWRATAAPATARRSPASSGSRTRRSAPSARASRSCSATRRRSATPSGRWCATRTASGRRCGFAEMTRHLKARGRDAARPHRPAAGRRTACRTRSSGRPRCRGPRAARASTPRWRRCARARRSGSARARSCAGSTARAASRRWRGERRPRGLPPSDLLAFQSEDGARLTVRPSGTEPKIKFYLELVGQAKDKAVGRPTRARLDAECKTLKAALMKELQLA